MKAMLLTHPSGATGVTLATTGPWKERMRCFFCTRVIRNGLSCSGRRQGKIWKRVATLCEGDSSLCSFFIVVSSNQWL